MLKTSERLRMTDETVEIEHLNIQNAALFEKSKVIDDMQS